MASSVDIIPAAYQKDHELLKWANYVAQTANGTNLEGLLGELSPTKNGGTFAGDMLPPKVLGRFVDDRYIVECANCRNWYHKV